jgi:anti-sigma factor RsiW
MNHYSEADLLETYYTRPGESMPVMMHLADCTECAARYERLERKMRVLSACHHERPESFWARQRSAILGRVRAERRPTPLARFAAAAALVFVLGGTLSWQFVMPPPVAPPAAEMGETSVVSDPWESEELEDLHPIVEWESWDETGGES